MKWPLGLTERDLLETRPQREFPNQKHVLTSIWVQSATIAARNDNLPWRRSGRARPRDGKVMVGERTCLMRARLPKKEKSKKMGQAEFSPVAWMGCKPLAPLRVVRRQRTYSQPQSSNNPRTGAIRSRYDGEVPIY